MNHMLDTTMTLAMLCVHLECESEILTSLYIKLSGSHENSPSDQIDVCKLVPDLMNFSAAPGLTVDDE